MRVIWKNFEELNKHNETTPLDGRCGVDTIEIMEDNNLWWISINDVVDGIACTSRIEAKHRVERLFFRKTISRKETIKTDSLIKIEEICMLYKSDPLQGLELIEEIAESALEMSR